MSLSEALAEQFMEGLQQKGLVEKQSELAGLQIERVNTTMVKLRAAIADF